MINDDAGFNIYFNGNLDSTFEHQGTEDQLENVKVHGDIDLLTITLHKVKILN